MCNRTGCLEDKWLSECVCGWAWVDVGYEFSPSSEMHDRFASALPVKHKYT